MSGIYGRLTILSFEKIIQGRAYWKCVCKCGNIKVASANSLRTGGIKSCGCLSLESSLYNIKKATTLIHGACSNNKFTRTYTTWKTMKQRCLNPKNTSFYRYGGRGIKICKRWLDFTNFILDMSERPLNKTLDRINTNGNYNKKNCQWATPKEQCRNTRKNTIVKIFGEKLCLAAAVEKYGKVSYKKVIYRLKIGWSVEKSLLTIKK